MCPHHPPNPTYFNRKVRAMTLYKGTYVLMDRFMVYLAKRFYDEDREYAAEHILERAIYTRLGGQLAIDQRWKDQWRDRLTTRHYFEHRASGQTPAQAVASLQLHQKEV